MLGAKTASVIGYIAGKAQQAHSSLRLRLCSISSHESGQAGDSTTAKLQYITMLPKHCCCLQSPAKKAQSPSKSSYIAGSLTWCPVVGSSRGPACIRALCSCGSCLHVRLDRHQRCSRHRRQLHISLGCTSGRGQSARPVSHLC